MTNPNAGNPMRNRHVVVRTIERAAGVTVDALAPLGTATVHEAIGRVGFLGVDIRPIQHDVRIAGSAVTVLEPSRRQPHDPRRGRGLPARRLLVVTNTAPSTHGMFGDLLATSLMSRGRPRSRDRCRRPRHERPPVDGVPRVEPVRVVPGHGEGDRRVRSTSRS